MSAIPNHQTGRSVSLSTRGVVAMAGTFGYELDLAKITDAEKDEIRQQIQQYKHYEELVREGNYYRLSNPFQDEYAAWLFVSEDEKRALLNVVMLAIHGNMAVNYVKLKGLCADAVYEAIGTGKQYYGSALMQAGLPMPVQQGEYLAYQIEFIQQ